MNALAKLNQVGVIHNDLKRDNIMIQCGRKKFKEQTYCIKIIDFGHAKLEGMQPYLNLTSERIKKYVQLDPFLANGGACS